MRNEYLHHFPKFQSVIRHLQVGNGALVPVLFVVPLVLKIQGHIFEVYTLVSEIQDKKDLILGVKNIFELEGVINSRTCSVNFLNRSLPIFPFGPSQNQAWKNGLFLSKNSICRKAFWYCHSQAHV